ncbi:hypothetical protein [Teichococcus aestuarii]|uniref:Uncharacterized protein n=1 Tax=Teichococcus aestuarii TaxID=568898 RepID=A0A2U1UY51_9PROT|nr:hypothetical protein [Pseudoroseomonas aestuarii]PWC26582.1 hypothetical protein CR165_22325 [Pseudoroseomonas aestuarii]
MLTRLHSAFLALAITAALSMSENAHADPAHATALPPQPQAALRYDAFEQPRLIRALIESDMATLMNFRIGLLPEQHGIPQGLTLYLKSFSQELSQIFLCPLLLPAGLEMRIERFMANRAMNPTAAGGTLLDALKILGERMNGSQASANPFDVRPLLAPLLDGQTAVGQVQSEGQRDARVFQAQTGCEGPEAEALAQGARSLMRHLRAAY